MSTSGGAGTLLSQSTIATYSVLGPPASLIGSELPKHPGSGPSLCPAPVLCQSVSYVQDHKPIDMYIRNIIPLGVRLSRRRSFARWAGAMLNFAFTEFFT